MLITSDCLLLGRNRCKDEAINHVGLGFVNNTRIRADCDGCLHFKPRRVSVDGLPRLQRNNASLPRFARLNKLRKECVAALAFVPARFLRKQKRPWPTTRIAARVLRNKGNPTYLHPFLHVFFTTECTRNNLHSSLNFSRQQKETAAAPKPNGQL